MGIFASFRQKPFALSANIEEMSLQVEVRVEDHDHSRFLWQTASGILQTYRYNRRMISAK